MNKQELYVFIEGIRQVLLKLGVKPPFDVFEICQKLSETKIESLPFKTKGLRGMSKIANDSSNMSYIIVNSNLSPAARNFHGIHELIHVLANQQNSGQTLSCLDIVKPSQNTYTEWIANEGAAELLVPYRTFLPLIKENYQKICCHFGIYNFCQEYSKIFFVSPMVLMNRVESLKYEIMQYLNGTAIDDITILSKKSQVKRGIFVKSLIDLDDEVTEKVLDELKPPGEWALSHQSQLEYCIDMIAPSWEK